MGELIGVISFGGGVVSLITALICFVKPIVDIVKWCFINGELNWKHILGYLIISWVLKLVGTMLLQFGIISIFK